MPIILFQGTHHGSKQIFKVRNQPDAWVLEQQAFASRGRAPNSITKLGKKWGNGLCRTIFQEVLQLWDLRNKARHGDSAQDVTAKRRDKLLTRAIEVQKFAKTLAGSEDRRLLHADSTLDEWPPQRLESFLSWAEELSTYLRTEAKSDWILTDKVRKPP